MAIYYIDPIMGDNLADGSTLDLSGLPTTGPKKTINGISAATMDDGDEIRLLASPAVDLGATFTMDLDSEYMTIDSTNYDYNFKIISENNTSWVASSNITCSTSTAQSKNSGVSSTIAALAAFTTGKMAYIDLGSAMDLSDYNCINFQVNCTGTSPTLTWEIRLCSDSTGDTAVQTFYITGLSGVRTRMVLFNSDFSTLPNNVRSIAMHTTVDPGTLSWTIGQMWAGSIVQGNDAYYPGTTGTYLGANLWSMFGAEDEEYFYIKYIDDTNKRLYLDNYHSITTASTNFRNYYASYTNEPLWSRQGFQTPNDTLIVAGVINMMETNSSKNTRLCVGGYRWDGANIKDAGAKTVSMLTVSSVSNSAGWTFRDIFFIAPSVGINITIEDGLVYNFVSNNTGTLIVRNCVCFSGGGAAVNGIIFDNCDIYRDVNSSAAIYGPGFGTTFKKCYFKTGSNSVPNFSPTGTRRNEVDFRDIYLIDNTFENTLITNSAFSSFGGIFSHNHNDTPGNHKMYGNQGTVIQWQTSEKQGSDPGSWEMIANYTESSHNKLVLKLAEVAVNSGTQVTVNVWVKKGNSTLVDASIYIPSFKTECISSDQEVYATDSTSWQQVQVQFTPSVSGVIPIYGTIQRRNTTSTNSCFFGSITVSQA
jgi:hypothetical protein